MLNPSFNRGIKGIIQKLAYPMYIVIRQPELKCTCVDQHEIADPDCPKCLGTGRKIRIRKIKGVMEPEDVSTGLNNKQQKVGSNRYYFDADDVTNDMMQQNNLIVREDEVDILQNPKKYRSDSNKVIYYHCEAAFKKLNRGTFLKNFKRLVGK